MSFELIVVVIVFVMIFNITTKMQKKIENQSYEFDDLKNVFIFYY